MAGESPETAAQRTAFVLEHEHYLDQLEPYADQILADGAVPDSARQSFVSLLQGFQKHRELYAEFRYAHPRPREVPSSAKSMTERETGRRRKLRREKILQARDCLQKQMSTYVSLSAATGDVFHDQDVNFDDLPIAARTRAFFQIDESEPIKFPAHERLNRAPEASPWKTPKGSGVALRPAPESGEEQGNPASEGPSCASRTASVSAFNATNVQRTRYPSCDSKVVAKSSPYRAKRQYFEPAHERFFMELMESGQQMSYGEIARRLNQQFGTHFDGKQCQQKWTRCLNPDISKGQWTAQEDEWLRALYEKHPGDFRAMAREMIHRSTQQVQSRWKVLNKSH